MTHPLLFTHAREHVGEFLAAHPTSPAVQAAAAGLAVTAGLPPLDLALPDEGALTLGRHAVETFPVPGHTVGHIAFSIPSARLVFTGDSLMSAGCGRLFEGTPEQMTASLAKFEALPDATRVYCAHEYTVSNLRFAVDRGSRA